MLTNRQWGTIAREKLAAYLQSAPDADFIEELAAHLAQTYDSARQQGLNDDEGREAALALLRHSSPWVEAARERDRLAASKGGFVEGLGIGRDIRHALRMLVRTPAFSLITVLTFAVGIGANAAVFSVVDGVLLRGLPYPDSDRITMVWVDNRREKIKEDINSYPNYRDWRDQNKVYDHLAGYTETAIALTGAGEPERLFGAQVTANFFDVMGLRPQIGRLFTVENETEGRNAVVVLSHGLWQRRFGGTPDVIGKSITLGSTPYEIIGVMAPQMGRPHGSAYGWPLVRLHDTRV